MGMNGFCMMLFYAVIIAVIVIIVFIIVMFFKKLSKIEKILAEIKDKKWKG